MGTGQSAQLQEHLKKWESALGDLESIAATNRRLLEQDRIYGEATRDEELERGAGRRASSLVFFNQSPNGPTPTTAADASGGNSVSGRARSSHNSPETRLVEAKAISFSNIGSGLGQMGGAEAGRSQGSFSGHQKHTRAQSQEIRRSRMRLFKSYELKVGAESGGMMECSHFGALAVALTYLLGGKDRRGRVTVEDIFFAAHVPLHFLHTSPPHLPVMTDIVRDFLDVDNRFKGEYTLETVHFDILLSVGQVDLGPNDVGDRQTRMQLTEFRRLLTQDVEDETQVVCLVNYDPYVLEQEMLVDAFDDDDEMNQLATSVLGNTVKHHRSYTPLNDGAYAVIVDIRNAVQLMVTIAEGVVSDSLNVKLTEVPAAALFKAMMSAEEGHRARGFIRIFKRDAIPDITHDEIKLFWTPELCSGKVLGSTKEGEASSAISHHITPHIVAISWALHLLGGTLHDQHGYGRGLPVSDIIRVMKFPADVYLDGNLPLEQVHGYAVEYLKRTHRPYVVNLYPVLTKISREDAVPSISVFDLESILLDVHNCNEDPEAPEHVMVIMYNACVGHNILYVGDQNQWCVLAGYDQETQTALLIDSHPKTFSRTWTCPLDRLHKAMTGTGYMVFSKTSATARPASQQHISGNVSNHSNNQSDSSPSITSNVERCVGAPLSMAPMVQARLELIDAQKHLGNHWTQPQSALQTFQFPSLPVMPTIVATAVSRLGPFTTFDDVIHRLPFAISSVTIRAFTLEALHVCMIEYLRVAGLGDQIHVTVNHGEHNQNGEESLPLATFRSLLETSQSTHRDDSVLIVHFDATLLQVSGATAPFGTLGVVVGYDKELSSVVISDCNPNSYLRTWAVSVTQLHQALCDTQLTVKPRMWGCLVVSKVGTSDIPQFPAAYTRNFLLELLPVKSIFHVSPSPHFQGMSLAMAQLGSFFSPEEIFYEAYLKTMNDQRLRGSQAFAWRDVDISLSVINKGIDATFMAKVCRQFLGSRESAGQQQRSGYLHVDVMEDIDGEAGLDALLKESTSSTDSVLVLNYDTEKAHHIPNLGRSVALVKSYDPEKKIVELWEAEFALFGLSLYFTVEQLVGLSGIDCHGPTPYGFVRFAKRDTQQQQQRRLPRGPRRDEEAD